MASYEYEQRANMLDSDLIQQLAADLDLPGGHSFQQARPTARQQKVRGEANRLRAARSTGSEGQSPLPQVIDSPIYPIKSGDALRSSVSAALASRPSMLGALRQRGDGPKPAARTHRPWKSTHTAARFVPNRPQAVVANFEGRMYAGQFSKAGNVYISAGQDDHVTLFNTSDPWNWQPMKTIEARDVHWTVTSVDITPDESFVSYTTMGETMHLVNTHGEQDLHEDLPLSAADAFRNRGVLPADGAAVSSASAGMGAGAQRRDSQFNPGMQHRTTVFCAKFSGTGGELLAGSGNTCVMLYDVERKTTTQCVPAHMDDINAVAWGDASANCNLVLTGSDDHMIKVWDRRTMGNYTVAGNGDLQFPRAAGYLPGHLQGVTSLDAHPDGRYVVSNAKDQTAKLWDLRKMTSSAQFDAQEYSSPFQGFDYRWGEWEGWGQQTRHPHDSSIMTYRGHTVLHTLIRAYFSPLSTTGCSYIVTGSADSRVVVYDVLTGAVVSSMKGHRGPVRDVSWHPSAPVIASTGFEGAIRTWSYSGSNGAADAAEARRTAITEAAFEKRAAFDANRSQEPDAEEPVEEGPSDAMIHMLLSQLRAQGMDVRLTGGSDSDDDDSDTSFQGGDSDDESEADLSDLAGNGGAAPL